MDLEFLKTRAAQFAYELRKNYPTGESPVTYYITKNEVVVISTKKLYIFFVGSFIDYKNELLSNVEFRNIDLNSHTCSVTLENKDFDLTFDEKIELDMLLMYHNKYKK